MDEHSLRVLEFEAVLRATASFCDTSLGQAQVLGLRPFQDKARLELELSRVAETGLYLTVEGGLDLTGLHDLTRFADRLETLGGFLDPEELDLFRQTLECLSRTRRRLTAKAQDYPLLAELGSGLADHQELIAELKRTFGPGLTIADGASPQLRRLRKRTGQLKAEIRRKLESLMADGQSQGLWQDEIVTQRNDRFVLPLKASRKGEIEGIIHDSSATRQTVYCEPLAVVGLNNQLGLMSAEERQEVIRILTRLTQRLGAIWPELSAAGADRGPPSPAHSGWGRGGGRGFGFSAAKAAAHHLRTQRRGQDGGPQDPGAAGADGLERPAHSGGRVEPGPLSQADRGPDRRRSGHQRRIIDLLRPAELVQGGPGPGRGVVFDLDRRAGGRHRSGRRRGP